MFTVIYIIYLFINEIEYNIYTFAYHSLFINSFIYLFIYKFLYLFIRSVIHRLIYLLIYQLQILPTHFHFKYYVLFLHSLINEFICLFICLFIHSLNCFFTTIYHKIIFTIYVLSYKLFHYFIIDCVYHHISY